MAIYHLTTKTVSKGKGQSSLAKAQYNMREGRYAEQEDKLVYAESGNLPKFSRGDHQRFWRNADHHERSNGRTAREIEIAIPKELPMKEQVDLTKRFAYSIVKNKHPYVLAIHRGKGTNPHAHILFSERQMDGIDRDAKKFFKRANAKIPEEGGAKKNVEFKKKEWLKEVRQRWADYANEALEKNGFQERIDARSLKEQGIERTPQRHLGTVSKSMVERGLDSDRGDQVLGENYANTVLVKASNDANKEYEKISQESQKSNKSQAKSKEQDYDYDR